MNTIKPPHSTGSKSDMMHIQPKEPYMNLIFYITCDPQVLIPATLHHSKADTLIIITWMWKSYFNKVVLKKEKRNYWKSLEQSKRLLWFSLSYKSVTLFQEVDSQKKKRKKNSKKPNPDENEEAKNLKTEIMMVNIAIWQFDLRIFCKQVAPK